MKPSGDQHSSISPARIGAFDILMRVEEQDAYASELLHSPRYQSLSPADHRLATELVMGVLRWRSRLDDEISGKSSQSLAKLDLEVLTTLRMGAYQLRYLDRIPTHAAIHEAVELVKRARKASAGGFVNAVLRKIATAPAQSRLQAPDSAEDLARQYAHPEWLVQRWIDEYGLESATRICEYDQENPAATIRLRNESAERALQEAGIQLAPGALLASARRVQSGDVTHTASFRSGQIAIQDEGSQLVALLVGRGARILDCCCAPGGKTSVLAERNPGAQLLATEIYPQRARLARRLIREPNVRIVAADARQLPLTSFFDRVLVDVPCSGTGTIARNPEIKWQLKPEDLSDLTARQTAILTAAMDRVEPGGKLIYSSCSLGREENAGVVERASQARPDFRLTKIMEELQALRDEGELVWPDLESLTSGPYLHTLPGVHPCDGFFAAILERKH
ncbi:MAG TPA: 16S rRNA (cytosine(967)-C(5))-methyltransferase RsmB [Terriglobales bacterium]|nr:16S rRNA (cytosine(967)-C(5))-methyltransferase RsmB [Terriglobales bacterium]